MTTGPIVSIAVVGALLLLGALLAWYWYLRRRRQKIRIFTRGERPVIDESAYHAVEPFIPTGPTG